MQLDTAGEELGDRCRRRRQPDRRGDHEAGASAGDPPRSGPNQPVSGPQRARVPVGGAAVRAAERGRDGKPRAAVRAVLKGQGGGRDSLALQQQPAGDPAVQRERRARRQRDPESDHRRRRSLLRRRLGRHAIAQLAGAADQHQPVAVRTGAGCGVEVAATIGRKLREGLSRAVAVDPVEGGGGGGRLLPAEGDAAGDGCRREAQRRRRLAVVDPIGLGDGGAVAGAVGHYAGQGVEAVGDPGRVPALRGRPGERVAHARDGAGGAHPGGAGRAGEGPADLAGPVAGTTVELEQHGSGEGPLGRADPGDGDCGAGRRRGESGWNSWDRRTWRLCAGGGGGVDAIHAGHAAVELDERGEPVNRRSDSGRASRRIEADQGATGLRDDAGRHRRGSTRYQAQKEVCDGGRHWRHSQWRCHYGGRRWGRVNNCRACACAPHDRRGRTWRRLTLEDELTRGGIVGGDLEP